MAFKIVFLSWLHFSALIHDALVSQFSSQNNRIYSILRWEILSLPKYILQLQSTCFWKYIGWDVIITQIIMNMTYLDIRYGKKIFVIFRKYIGLQMYIFTGSLNKKALQNAPWGLQGHQSTGPKQQWAFFSSLSLVLESAPDQKRSKGVIFFYNKVNFSSIGVQESCFCMALLCTNFCHVLVT